jgi:hypothetical protein
MFYLVAFSYTRIVEQTTQQRSDLTANAGRPCREEQRSNKPQDSRSSPAAQEGMMKLKRTGVAVILLSAATAALALPSFVTDFKKLSAVKPESALGKQSCGICHNGMKTKEFNPYGADLKKAMEAAKVKKVTPEILKVVADKDSDGDGVKNGDEIKAGTLPGDKTSR